MDSFAERFELQRESRLWLPYTMFQIGFMEAMGATITVGATLISCRRFDATEAMRTLIDEHVTHAVPIYATYWLPISCHPEFRPSELIDLAYAVVVGPPDLLKRVQRSLPQCVFMQMYGSAETGGGVCLPRTDDVFEVRLGAVGRPHPRHEVASCRSALGGAPLAGTDRRN